MKVLGPEKNFLSIMEEKRYLYKDVRYVIQSIPYEHTSSYITGSAMGPAAIIQASHFVEFFDEELNFDATQFQGIATLDPLELKGKYNKEAIDEICSATEAHIREGKFVISLGAEHSVTYGLVQAHNKHFENLSVLQIDAHSDLRDSYQGNKYSHASVMARVHELGIKIAQVGIRAQDQREAELIELSDKITTIYAHQVRSMKDWQQILIKSLTDNVYITIDADGFDPAVTPAVGTPEPGGLLWQETLDFLRQVIEEKNVVGFDIVEISPREGDVLTEFCMAKLCYKLIAAHCFKNQNN